MVSKSRITNRRSSTTHLTPLNHIPYTLYTYSDFFRAKEEPIPASVIERKICDDCDRVLHSAKKKAIKRKKKEIISTAVTPAPRAALTSTQRYN